MTDTKISVNQVDKIIKTQTRNCKEKITIPYKVADDEIIEIVVTPLLSVDEMNSMVNSIAETICNDTYNPDLYELVYSKAIMAYYTNLKTDITNDKLNQIVYCTDIIEKIVNIINPLQLADINDAVDKSIEFKKQEILSTENRLLKENLNQLISLTNIMSEMGEKMNDINIKELMENCKKIADIPEKQRVQSILEIHEEKEDINNVQDHDIDS